MVRINPQDFYNQAVSQGFSGDKVKAYMQSKGINTDTIDVSGNSGTHTASDYGYGGAQPASDGSQTPPFQAPPTTPAPTTPAVDNTPSLPTTDTSGLNYSPVPGSSLVNKPMPAISSIAKTKPGGIIGTIEDWLPVIGSTLGGVGGGVLGTLVEPGGGTVAGGALGATGGGALGEAAKELLEGGKLSPSDIALQGGVGGVSDLAGGVVGTVASKALGALGSKLLPKIGADTFSSVVKASPSYAKDLGELSNAADKYGLMNIPPNQALGKLPGIMSDLGKQITSKLQSAGPVAVKTITDNFNKYLGTDAKYFSANPQYKSAIDDVMTRLTGGTPAESGILDASGKPIASSLSSARPALDVYKLKSDLGDELGNAFKKLAPGGSGVLTPNEEIKMLAWNSLKDTIDGISPEVRAINQDQHLMYPISQGLVKAFQKSGKSGGIFSDFVAGEGGQALAQTLGQVPGLGFALGFGAKKLAESPSLIQGAGKAIGSTAGKIVSGAAGALAGTGLGQLLPPIGNSAVNAPSDSQNSTDNQTHSASIPPSLANVNPDDNGHFVPKPLDAATVVQGYMPDSIFAQKMAQATGNDPAQKTIQALKDLSDKNRDTYLANNKINPSDQQWMQNSPLLFAQVNYAHDLMASTPPSILNNVQTVEDLKKINSSEYAKFAAVTKYLSTEVGKMQQGGVLRNFDLTSMGDVMPSLKDSPAQFAAKIDMIGRVTQARYNALYVPYTLTTGGVGGGVPQQTLQQAQQ